MTTDELTETQRRNLALAEELTDAYESAGVRVFLDRYDEFFHPDFAMTPAIAQLGGEEYRGPDGVAKWIADMDEIATDYTLREIEVRAVDDFQLLVLGRMHLVGKESGAAFESEYAWLYRVKDERVVAGRAYLSHAEAARAAEEAAKEVREAGGGGR